MLILNILTSNYFRVTRSLEIDVFLTLAQGSHERVGPESIDSSFIIYVVVLPSLVKVLLQESCFLHTSEPKVALNNLGRQFFCLIFHDEELFVWFALWGHTFGGEILKNVSGKLINGVVVSLFEVSWQDSLVSIFPFSVVVVISYETVLVSVESFEIGTCFLDSTGLGHIQMMSLIMLREHKSLMKVLSRLLNVFGITVA